MTRTALQGLALTTSLTALGCADPSTAGTDDSGDASAESTSGTSTPTGGETASPGTSEDSTGTGTSGTTATTDSGESTDTSTGGALFGEPIVVDPQDLETWVWVPFPDMYCADGSTSGVMVNFTAQSRDLMIYFQGGGACWNALTCAAQGPALAPWEADPFAAWAADGGPINGGLFARDDPSNPLARHNYVYVPYCTGDGHLGDNVADYGVHHVGYANAAAMIDRVVPTFSDAPQIVVAGFSAGGMGATGNYHQIASAFESIGRESLVLINDAGPFMRAPFLSPNSATLLRGSWATDTTIETWCTTCASEGYHTLYSTQVALHPGVRSSLLCSYNDSVVRLLYGVLGSPIELGACENGLRDLGMWRDEVAPEVAPALLREFFYPGDRHGATEGVPLAETPGLAEFLTAQLSDDPSWTSVRP